MAKAPRPQAMPSDISRKMIVTSFGILHRRPEPDDAGGAGNAERARERVADDDHHHRAGDAEQDLRVLHRAAGGPVVRRGRMNRRHQHADQRGGDQLDQRDERLGQGREAGEAGLEASAASGFPASGHRRPPPTSAAHRAPPASTTQTGPTAPPVSVRHRRVVDGEHVIELRELSTVRTRGHGQAMRKSRQDAAPTCAP